MSVSYPKVLSALNIASTSIEKTEIRAPFSGVIGLRSVSEGSYVTSSIIMATFALQGINLLNKFITIMKIRNIRNILFTRSGTCIPDFFKAM